MAKSEAKSVKQYLAELPAERRKDIEAVRKVIRKNLPRGYVEEMGYGMITYNVAQTILPAGETYNKQPLLYAALAAQKNFNALYLMWMGDKPGYERFAAEFKAEGKKLDKGKSCIRFQRPGDLALDAVGKAIGRTKPGDFVVRYHLSREK